MRTTSRSFKFALTYIFSFPFAIWNSNSSSDEMSKQTNRSDLNAKSTAGLLQNCRNKESWKAWNKKVLNCGGSSCFNRLRMAVFKKSRRVRQDAPTVAGVKNISSCMTHKHNNYLITKLLCGDRSAHDHAHILHFNTPVRWTNQSRARCCISKLL